MGQWTTSPHRAGLFRTTKEFNMTVQTNEIRNLLANAHRENRSGLYEHEVYHLVHASGAVMVPRTIFVPAGKKPDPNALEQVPGSKVVLKLSSIKVTHKSDIGGVVFVDRSFDSVCREIDAMHARCKDKGVTIDGVMISQYFENAGAQSYGNELFMGLRATREFGPVISSGLGGIHTEYFATNLRKGAAITTALALETTGDEFFDRFRHTMAYEILAGKARGYSRLVADENLRECFQAFIKIARDFCVTESEDLPTITDLEINPFAFMHGFMVPLDGVCKLGKPPVTPAARPIHKIRNLLHPESIAVVGASSRNMNMGRVILNNVVECQFDKAKIYAIKSGEKELDGVQCVESLSALPEKVDLTVLAVGAEHIPSLTEEILTHKASESAIVIPGGMGETEGGKEVEAQVRKQIAESHETDNGGSVFLGGNCLGVQSRPGKYDTMFIPSKKLAKRYDRKGRPIALISQSGAYVITRMSNLESLDPCYAISVGNQIDITMSDLLQYLVEEDMIKVFGVYVEGFRDMDGLAFSHAVKAATQAGKDVIFYKAGRTAAGQKATATHTASIAGDYNVCEAAISNAGGLVCETFKEFEAMVEIASQLYGCSYRGTRIGAISNAGYETVGMADSVKGPHYSVSLPDISQDTGDVINTVLKKHKLQSLVSLRNPLDLTPMANDDAHVDCIEAMLQADELDAVIASFVPLTPAMKTAPDEIESEQSMMHRVPQLFEHSDKPLVVVIDSGSLYDPMARSMREAGVPVFRSADDAVRCLGRYMCHKLRVNA